MEGKRTKIIATIGPASSSVSILTRMMRAGMDVARLNFSHGSHKDHRRLALAVRQAAKKAGKEVAILQDLQGPKIRVGELLSPIEIRNHQKIVFSTAVKSYENGGAIPVTYKNLHKDVKRGDRILLDDGLLEAVVTAVRGKEVSATVVTGGLLKSHKGMNLPDTKVSVSAFTEKDHDDLLFGIEVGVDWVALSFVTDPEVVKRVRKIAEAKAKSLKQTPPKILAKIERKEAIERFPEILEVVDAVMLARGDLGIEIPFEQVPLIQKEFIEICRQAGKPVVVATHMLDSMTEHPRATRAEVSDVANAVIDHADAIMLSQESATGKYPYLAVHTMAVVALEAEHSRLDDIMTYQTHEMQDIAMPLSQAVHMMAENGLIDAIVTSVTYKQIAGRLTLFRPNVPIIMACPNETVARQMVLSSGVTPFIASDDAGTFVHRMEQLLRSQKIIKKSGKAAFLLENTKGDVSVVIR